MKKWMIILLVVVAALLLPVLLAIFWPQPKGMPTPPPGPHKAGDVWLADLGGRTTMAMVWCPPGKFMMGSPASEPGRQPFGPNEAQHEVTLTQGFWLGKYEVTQRQWRAVMGANPSHFPEKDVIRWKLWKWEIPVWRKDFLVNRWSLPVEQMSRDDCQEFCQRAGSGFRLPTEAEWESACRAGSVKAYAGTGRLEDMGWYDDNSGYSSHPVGRKQPNAWGLHDMHGNVWEWCQDRYDTYPAGAVTDPAGPVTGANRVIRGGCWRDNASGCRAAIRYSYEPGFRYSYEPGFRYDFLGFRAAFAPAVKQ